MNCAKLNVLLSQNKDTYTVKQQGFLNTEMSTAMLIEYNTEVKHITCTAILMFQIN